MRAPPINILIVHGTLGHPSSNWFPWLKDELVKDGHIVEIPLFPSPDNQCFTAWREIALNTLQDWDKSRTLLIGHRLGASFIFRLAEEAKTPFKGVFSICPFVRDVGLDPYDELNRTFIHHPFDWPLINRNTGRAVCIAGGDDPYVPLSYSKEVADSARAEWIVVEKGGHLNAEFGYLKFPLLLDKIRQTIAI